MRGLPDRRLPEPFDRWIDRAVALPPDVVLLPRTIDVGGDAVAFFGLLVPLGAVGAFFLLIASRIRPQTDGWAPLVITAGGGLALWSAPVFLLRRLIRTVGARKDRDRGVLRQGIFVGPEGALVRMERDSGHPIPPDRFVSATLVPSIGRGPRTPTIVVETLDGRINLFADRLDGHPGRIAEAARGLWPGSLPPRSRGKRKVKVDHARTAGMRRAAWLFGASILAFGAVIAALRIGGASRSEPEVQVAVVASLMLVPAAIFYALFEWVRMRAFYRCPRCGARPARVAAAMPAIHYFCAACNVEWATGLEESDYDS
jgi:hypothetical protein